jgi:hypothetical protein
MRAMALLLILVGCCHEPREVCYVKTDRGGWWLTPEEMNVSSCEEIKSFYNSRGIDPSRGSLQDPSQPV